VVPQENNMSLGRRLSSSCPWRRPSSGGDTVDRGSEAGGGPVGRGCNEAVGQGFFAGGVGRGGRAMPEMPRGTEKQPQLTRNVDASGCC
jgi:hypothetical protein